MLDAKTEKMICNENYEVVSIGDYLFNEVNAMMNDQWEELKKTDYDSFKILLFDENYKGVEFVDGDVKEADMLDRFRVHKLVDKNIKKRIVKDLENEDCSEFNPGDTVREYKVSFQICKDIKKGVRQSVKIFDFLVDVWKLTDNASYKYAVDIFELVEWVGEYRMKHYLLYSGPDGGVFPRNGGDCDD